MATWALPPCLPRWASLPRQVEKSIRLVFDASETFDVGMDLGAPVSLNYADRAPFKRLRRPVRGRGREPRSGESVKCMVNL